MAEKLLKAKKRKIVAKNSTDGRAASMRPPRKVVLVGTYAGDQLKAWPGYYPYPLSAGDKIDAASAKKVNEIWLFKGTKEPRYFAAECLGMKTREELKVLGYPAKGKGHGDGTYLLFKIEKTYASANASAALAASVESVIIRTKDFAKRSPKVAKQLKVYLESPDRKNAALANQLPSIVTKLPPQVLRVCEAAVQMEFLPYFGFDVAKLKVNRAEKAFDEARAKGRLTCVEICAGAGGQAIGLERAGFSHVALVEYETSEEQSARKDSGETCRQDEKSECKLLGFLWDHPTAICEEFPESKVGCRYERLKMIHDEDFCIVREMLRKVLDDKNLLHG